MGEGFVMGARKYYAEDIAKIVEQIGAPGMRRKGDNSPRRVDIAESMGISEKTLCRILDRAYRFGFEAYPLRENKQ